MANLNFQQPPRSIASAALSSRQSSGGGPGFVGNSLSGHVTPTSGMFTQNSNSIAGANSIINNNNNSYNSNNMPAQLSPNRSVQMSGGGGGVGNIGGGLIGGGGGGGGGGNIGPAAQMSQRTSIFGQRTNFSDRRPIQGLGTMQNMGSFMQSRGYGPQSGGGGGLNNFHSVFGGGNNDTGTPPLLDLSEFPSLTNARGNDSMPQQSNSLQPPGSKPYVGMVKQPTAEQSEFQMSSEDFPALPGTQLATDGSMVVNSLGGLVDQTDKTGAGSSVGGAGGVVAGMDLQAESMAAALNEKAFQRGVQTSAEGKVTNIPASMVNNQFGMVGLLTFIRAAESDPNLVTLAMGQDLTGLGLNLNSQENLYPTFGGPFSDQPCRPQDIDFHVPPEYLVNISIRDKLASMTLKKYKDDLLFFLFYANVGDIMQIAAAAELHSRDWRYHVDEKVWITRVPGVTHYEKTGTTERGTFYYFDAQNWRRVPKDFLIDTGKLDKCPNLNTYLSGQPV